VSQVIIRQVDPAGPSVVCELADDDDLSGGVGGWVSLDRPRDTAAAAWVGTPEQTYTLPLLLDGMDVRPGVDVPVEADCAQLTAWGKGDEATSPPVLQVLGPVLVGRTDRWVLQGLAWGARERDDAERRIQQYVTLTLLEHRTPVLLKNPAKKARKHKPKPHHGGKPGK
jgi:hypothetical protein